MSIIWMSECHIYLPTYTCVMCHLYVSFICIPGCHTCLSIYCRCVCHIYVTLLGIKRCHIYLSTLNVWECRGRSWLWLDKNVLVGETESVGGWYPPAFPCSASYSSVFPGIYTGWWKVGVIERYQEAVNEMKAMGKMQRERNQKKRECRRKPTKRHIHGEYCEELWRIPDAQVVWEKSIREYKDVKGNKWEKR